MGWASTRRERKCTGQRSVRDGWVGSGRVLLGGLPARSTFRAEKEGGRKKGKERGREIGRWVARGVQAGSEASTVVRRRRTQWKRKRFRMQGGRLSRRTLWEKILFFLG